MLVGISSLHCPDVNDGRLVLRYTSQTRAALSIAPEEKNNSTIRVATGWEPPQEFIDSELVGIASVEIDGRLAWVRLPF